MLSQQSLYPEGFTFIPPPASPSDNIPPATVQQHMGAYYPRTAQCPVQTFETSGWTGCLAYTQARPVSRVRKNQQPRASLPP
jgi:hypothetical protein